MVSKQSVNYEHKFELQSELERLPSHFNHKIEKVSTVKPRFTAGFGERKHPR